VAYLRFEAEPDEEFDHYLAQKLGMTVARMRDEVSSDEWLRWSVYFGRKAQRQELEMKQAQSGK
jgi:hypothetical protein